MSRFVPEHIVGDLDSLRPDVRAYDELHVRDASWARVRAAQGTDVTAVASQDNTDFDKALDLLQHRREQAGRVRVCAHSCRQVDEVLVLGSLGASRRVHSL